MLFVTSAGIRTAARSQSCPDCATPPAGMRDSYMMLFLTIMAFLGKVAELRLLEVWMLLHHHCRETSWCALKENYSAFPALTNNCNMSEVLLLYRQHGSSQKRGEEIGGSGR